MKANFLCFKLSKTIILLLLTILIEIIFIIVGIRNIKEEKSFEDIKKKIDSNVITQDNTMNKNSISNDTNVQNNIEQKNENDVSKEDTKALEEYKNMPREVKGYKVIRKNNNSKTKIRQLYFRRNK